MSKIISKYFLVSVHLGEKSVNLDDSLTNIQWLGGLASEGLVPKSKPGAVPSGKEIERVKLISQVENLHIPN